MTIDVVTSEPSLWFNQEHLAVASRELLFNLKKNEAQHTAVPFEAKIKYDLDAEEVIKRLTGSFVLHDIKGSPKEPLYFVELSTKLNTTHRGLILVQRADSRQVYSFREVRSDLTLTEVILHNGS